MNALTAINPTAIVAAQPSNVPALPATARSSACFGRCAQDERSVSSSAISNNDPIAKPAINPVTAIMNGRIRLAESSD